MLYFVKGKKLSSMKIIANNKKAFFEYEILDKIEAGIVLEGSEVKSVREGHISLLGSFIFISNGQAYLKNAFIKNYVQATAYVPDEHRSRVLLLNKKEIVKIDEQIKQKGLSCVPLKVYFNDKGRVKLEIGVGRGKKLFDKRQTIKERELKRDLQRKLK